MCPSSAEPTKNHCISSNCTPRRSSPTRKARGSNPPGRTKSSTLWGAALFVLHGFYGAAKGRIRTARALRFASRGAETPQWELSVFRCLHDEPVPPATRQTPAGPPRCKDGWVECPRQTVNDFIGIRGSVCGLFLFVQTHAPLDICEQHTMCLISVSHIVMFAEKTYNAFEPVGHTKRGKERES